MASCIPIIRAAFFALTHAHGGVYTYNIDSKNYTGLKSPYSEPRYGLPEPNRPYTLSLFTDYVPIKSGGSVTAWWSNTYVWDKNAWSCDDEYLSDPAHECGLSNWIHAHGPMMVYMAAYPGSCSDVRPSTLSWFKITQEGLRPGHKAGDAAGWLQGDIMGKPLTVRGWIVKIPKSLKSGNYLIRHEILGLESDCPHLYPQCAQLNVTGTGIETKAPGMEYLVKFPGAYRPSDLGLNVYT
ncbi:glycosyl hydrolase family 61-domain-containing protein [Lophiotrema nucula]|uniref:AA9 family lytic polysaccharide monooxygenase n=1 Tax=Lophiotrema nucula TaxID=690887 RepID=A0A6A5ZFE7_9PLEO|nr:glycosyl hydrolase family 61-domain-containing protein [Lophiotrema nucula]